MKTIHRYKVPVDDQWHEFKLTGHILHVDCRDIDVVEFWAHEIKGNPAETVQLRVFGTGHEIPVASVYRGTTIAPGGRFVWHLIQAVDEELYAASTGPEVVVTQPVLAEYVPAGATMTVPTCPTCCTHDHSTQPVPTGEEHPESICHYCGGPNRPWSAPSPLWNAVMRGGDINGGPEPHSGIICPTCFMVRAEDMGIAELWRLTAERVRINLQTVTPSGRIWNEQTWLWDEPVPTGEATAA